MAGQEDMLYFMYMDENGKCVEDATLEELIEYGALKNVDLGKEYDQ